MDERTGKDKMKTVLKDIENLRNKYNDIQGKLAEIRDEISKNIQNKTD